MTDNGKGVFDEIERIERQADELLEKAKADAADVTKKSGDEIKQLAADTDREIEQANAKLDEEHKARIEQALTEIDADFLREEEALETVCEERLDELVAWTAGRITERLRAAKD
ncbi:MAG: hypothetical protein ABIF82_13295 [Planctomycetota bacterium]